MRCPFTSFLLDSKNWKASFVICWFLRNERKTQWVACSNQWLRHFNDVRSYERHVHHSRPFDLKRVAWSTYFLSNRVRIWWTLTIRAAWVDFTLVAWYGSEYVMNHSTPVMMSLHTYQWSNLRFNPFGDQSIRVQTGVELNRTKAIVLYIGSHFRLDAEHGL